MQNTNKWLISLEHRDTHYKISIYTDGRVYGPERGQILYRLSKDEVQEIINIYKSSLSILRTHRYIKNDRGNLIIRINDNDDRNTIKITNEQFEDKIMNVLKRSARSKIF